MAESEARNVADGWSAINATVGTWLSPVTLMSANVWGIGHWSRAVSCLLIHTARVHII